MATGTAPIDYTPDVLMNSGVPIHLFPEGGEGEPVIEHLRFTFMSLAMMDKTFAGYRVETSERGSRVERHLGREVKGKRVETKVVHTDVDQVKGADIYYGQEAVQAALVLEPAVTLVKVMTIVLAGDPTVENMAKVGARMIPTELPMYNAAVNAALQLANGADPTLAADALVSGRDFVAAAAGFADKTLEAMTVEAREAIDALSDSTDPDEAVIVEDS